MATAERSFPRPPHAPPHLSPLSPPQAYFQNKLRLALIGQSLFGQEVYTNLRKQGHKVVGVFTVPDKDGKADPLGEWQAGRFQTTPPLSAPLWIWAWCQFSSRRGERREGERHVCQKISHAPLSLIPQFPADYITRVGDQRSVFVLFLGGLVYQRAHSQRITRPDTQSSARLCTRSHTQRRPASFPDRLLRQSSLTSGW